jgi:hypothetical protein
MKHVIIVTFFFFSSLDTAYAVEPKKNKNVIKYVKSFFSRSKKNRYNGLTEEDIEIGLLCNGENTAGTLFQEADDLLRQAKELQSFSNNKRTRELMMSMIAVHAGQKYLSFFDQSGTHSAKQEALEGAISALRIAKTCKYHMTRSAIADMKVLEAEISKR